MNCSVRKCKREAALGFKRCQHHIDYAKDYYRDPKPKRPGQCGYKDCPRDADPGFKSCSICRQRTKKYEDSIREELKAERSARYQQIRTEALRVYGDSKCTCCGETHREFLTIDHINGDGAAHRKEVGSNNIYYWLKKNNFPPGFRVLCMNCNFSLGHHGLCPHNSGLTQVTAAVLAKRDQSHVPTPASAL